MRVFIKILIAFLVFQVSSACMKGEKVDLIIHNAMIYSMDDNDHVFEAMAIKDGIIVEMGPERQILNKYHAAEFVDAQGKDVYPGLTDAHGHMFSLAEQKLTADLVGSKSFEEVLVRMEKYKSRSNKDFLIGRGWDQSLWNDTRMPNNEKLSQLFPNQPAALFRVDGHAVLVNDFLLKKLKIDEKSRVEGGIILVEDGKCSGLLIDNAMNPVFEIIPPFTKQELGSALLEIQQELFQYGITGVHEAGVYHHQVTILKDLIQRKKLDLNIYAMLYPEEENIAFAKKHGVYSFRNLLIRSFKVVGDGALGSRGACLKEAYADQHQHFGVLTTSPERMKEIAKIARSIGYQMNTHAIGDSTNKLVIDEITETFLTKKDHRWRIEHAQVLSLNDITRLGECGAFPSVQPVHAVSDQRWALERLGAERIKGAYAYNSILNQTGMCAIGTDFPVESFDPIATLFASVKRKNTENFPADGFYKSESISFAQCMKGMTIWAAFAAFQERDLGSLEKGKHATFVIWNEKLQVTETYKPNFAFHTYIKGKKVYAFE